MTIKCKNLIKKEWINEQVKYTLYHLWLFLLLISVVIEELMFCQCWFNLNLIVLLLRTIEQRNYLTQITHQALRNCGTTTSVNNPRAPYGLKKYCSFFSMSMAVVVSWQGAV